jgi:hypothetical protein
VLLSILLKATQVRSHQPYLFECELRRQRVFNGPHSLEAEARACFFDSDSLLMVKPAILKIDLALFH